MRRREFVIGVGGTAVSWPLAARAQQPERMRRVGLLMPFANKDPLNPIRIKSFEEKLTETGWTDRNVRLDWRWAGVDPDELRNSAREIVELKPDVVVANTSPALVAMRRETQTIPTVFLFVSDPVGGGMVQSLAKPGGNITGFTPFEPSLTGKWLEILKEIAPEVVRTALLFSAENHGAKQLVGGLPSNPSIKVAAQPAADAASLEKIAREQARESGGSLVVLPDGFTVVHREQIIALAAQYRLPAIYPFRFFAQEGGLVSYGIDNNAVYRQAASYVDRILRGANPGELPVQGPTKFELVINLRTVKTLGLTIPPTLLVSADEVIE